MKNLLKKHHLVFLFITACASQSEAPQRPSIRLMLQEPVPPPDLALPANWEDYTEEQKKSWKRLEQVQAQTLQKQHRFNRDKDIYQKCWGLFECVR